MTRETILDIWPFVLSLIVIGYMFYTAYLSGALDENRRHVDTVERARDKWKKRATDAEGAAGSLRYAYERCKARLARREGSLVRLRRERDQLYERAVQAEVELAELKAQ